MTPSFELLLALGVVGFYVWDSAMLLYANELVYLHSKGRWSFITATSRMQLVGRYLYLPNLLSPQKALFRVCWSASSSQQGHIPEAETLTRMLTAVDSLRYLIYPLWILMIAVLPVTLIVYGASNAFLLVLGLIYIVILALLINLYNKRAELGLSKWTLAKIAFDSLACAPLALNVVRKITLRYSLPGDPLRFAQTRFDTTTFSNLVTVLDEWIASELEFEDEMTPRYQALNGYKKILERMAP